MNDPLALAQGLHRAPCAMPSECTTEKELEEAAIYLMRANEQNRHTGLTSSLLRSRILEKNASSDAWGPFANDVYTIFGWFDPLPLASIFL